jgi:hypothetical protein
MKNLFRVKTIIYIAIVYFIITRIINACEKNLNGGYYLGYIDTPDQMTIYNSDGVGVIGSTVFSVGQNDKYIIAKQHPNGIRGEICFYIISIERQKVYGPMRYDYEVSQIKKELNVGDIDFTIVYHDLE